MTNALAVFAATGQQGSSFKNNILNDPEIFNQYKVRAIARDINSSAAMKLKDQVEVVQSDKADFGPNAVEIEYTNGKTIADVAVEMGIQYIIFGTLPWPAFDAKATIEQCIRGLPIKRAFVSLGSFVEDFQAQLFLAENGHIRTSLRTSRRGN